MKFACVVWGDDPKAKVSEGYGPIQVAVFDTVAEAERWQEAFYSSNAGGNCRTLRVNGDSQFLDAGGDWTKDVI